MTDPTQILDFWFGPIAADGTVGTSYVPRWWKKDAVFDDEIRSRFGALHASASVGEYETWCGSAKGRLALIIVLDQFSRNLFRDDPRTWAQDERALRYASAALEGGEDSQLPAVQRPFLYMPFMHAEDLSQQERCVACFERLVREAAPALTESLQGNLRFAKIHRDIVARFGRFPHRNATLGRRSSPEEVEFLTQPNSSF
ncbi:MAG: DUF924 family protein [Nannocystaceae bacterium]